MVEIFIVIYGLLTETLQEIEGGEGNRIRPEHGIRACVIFI